MSHLQRSEDVLLRVDVERFAAELFDQRAEGDEVDVGVVEVGARRGDERRVHRAADAFGFVGRGEAPGVFEADIGRQAGVVGQQFADGDIFFAVGGEVGKVLRDRIVEVELVLPRRVA